MSLKSTILCLCNIEWAKSLHFVNKRHSVHIQCIIFLHNSYYLEEPLVYIYVQNNILVLNCELLGQRHKSTSLCNSPTNRTTEAYIWRVFKFLID